MKTRTRVLLGVALVAGLLGIMAVARRSGKVGVVNVTRPPGATERSEAPALITKERRKSPPRPPATVIADLKEEIRESGGSYGYRSGSYLFSASHDSVTAALPLRMKGGQRPTLTLALDDIRVGDHVLSKGGTAAPQLDKEARTIIYPRGQAEERYTVRDDAFEQEFVIRELPPARGEVVVRVTASSNLTPPGDGTKAAELSFKGSNLESFTLSQAAAVDNSGRKLPLEMAYAKGEVTLTLPSEWVASASLPITIDPLVGGSFVLDPSVSISEVLDVGYSPLTNEWMVVWANSFESAQATLYAQRVSASGALVGSRFIVDTGTSDGEPFIAYSQAANRYCVIWTGVPSGGSGNRSVLGRFLNPDGTMPQTAFTIIDGSAFQADQPSIAADGIGGFYVIARSNHPSSGLPIVGSLISPAGAVTSGIDPDPVTGGNWPRVAYANGEYMVNWWNNTGIIVRGVSTTGTMLTGLTVVGPLEGPNAGDITAAGDRFLVSWTAFSVNRLKGRFIQADSASSINYGSSVFEEFGATAYYPAAVMHSEMLPQYAVRIVLNLASPG
jgi:hypothetical protein